MPRQFSARIPAAERLRAGDKLDTWFPRRVECRGENSELQTNTSLTASTTTTRRQISRCNRRFWMLYGEFKVLTGTYSAEYAGGRWPGHRNDSSGNERFSRLPVEFHRNSRRNFSQRKSHRSDEIILRRAGGPIKKYRTFFFGRLRGQRADSRKRAWRPFLGLSSEMAISAPFQRRRNPLMK